MEKMFSQLIKSQDATAKSLETKMSDLMDQMSTVGRSLQGSPSTGSDPTLRSVAPPGHAWMASAPYPLPWTTLSSHALERSKEEVGFRPLKVIGRPVDKESVNTNQGYRWNELEVGENLGQEIIIESHTVGPEVQRIQNPAEALFPVERIGVAPGVSTGLAPQKYHKCNTYQCNTTNKNTIHLYNNKIRTIHSFILETYIAPLQETTTQRRSQPSHGQKRRT